MAHKPTTKIAKPSVTTVKIQSVVLASTAATVFSLVAGWQVHTEEWSKLVYDFTLIAAAIMWVGVIALAHARHVTLYIRNCAALGARRHDQTQHLIKARSLVGETERYLRSREN